MIQLGQLTSIADRDKVEARIVERDYVLMHVLSAIYRSGDASDLVFKGGTLLRACYFDDYRYSADLDFSLRGNMSVEAATGLVENALISCREEIGFELLDLRRVGSREWNIAYRRPYGANGQIKLNIADDELVGEPERLPLLVRYPDIPGGCEVVAYGFIEVAAEKLRCVIQRVQARDFFDLHHLLVEQGVDVQEAWRLFEDKAAHKNLDPTAFGGKLDERVPVYKTRWQDELSGYMGHVPPFERVERELRGKIRPFLS